MSAAKRSQKPLERTESTDEISDHEVPLPKKTAVVGNTQITSNSIENDSGNLLSSVIPERF